MHCTFVKHARIICTYQTCCYYICAWIISHKLLVVHFIIWIPVRHFPIRRYTVTGYFCVSNNGDCTVISFLYPSILPKAIIYDISILQHSLVVWKIEPAVTITCIILALLGQVFEFRFLRNRAALAPTASTSQSEEVYTRRAGGAPHVDDLGGLV